MADAMDESWRAMRGMEIQSVAIASLSYDEASQKLIQMRNEGAMMSDPSIREGYVQGAMARSMEKAAANPNGAMNGFRSACADPFSCRFRFRAAAVRTEFTAVLGSTLAADPHHRLCTSAVAVRRKQKGKQSRAKQLSTPARTAAPRL